MGKNWIHACKPDAQDIPRPVVDPDWRIKNPEGSIVKIAEYDTERGWYWREYRILKYYPHIVHCIDDRGFNRGFGNWEFQKRQIGKLDGAQGTASRWEGERNLNEENLVKYREKQHGKRKRFWVYD